MSLFGVLCIAMASVKGGGPAAQQPPPPPADGPAVYRAVEIRFEPENAFALVSAETYLYHLRTRPISTDGGTWRTYDERELLDDFDRLWATEFLDDLRIEVLDVPFPNGANGKHVTFVLTERLRVKGVSYRGAGRIGSSAIEEALKTGNIDLKPDGFLDAMLLRRASGAIRQLYVDEGFIAAKVTPVTRPVAANGRVVELAFDVTEGPQTRILETMFEGNVEVSDATLRRQMKHNKARGVFSFVTGGTTFNATNHAEDAEALERFYRDRGYINARVGEPRLEQMSESADGTTRWVRMAIPLDEGSRFRIGKVSIVGNALLPTPVIAHVFRKLQPGEFYQHGEFEAAREDLQNLYGSSGYMDFTAYPEFETVAGADTPTIDLVVRLEEGSPYTVRRLSFAGHTSTRDEVIRREFRLVEGGVFNTEALRYSIRRLNQLGYFKPIETEGAVSVTPVDGQVHAVDVKVKVEEQNRNQISFGAGVSQYDGVFGNLSFQTSNFLGRGETVSVTGQRGQLTTTYQLAASTPYLAGRPIGAGVSVYSNKVNYRGSDGEVFYSEVRQGVSVTGALTRGFVRYASQFSFENIRSASLSTVTTSDLLRSGHYTESRISPSVVYNTVDQPVFPRRGIRLVGSVDVAGGPLGGALSYIKPEWEVLGYRPIGRRLSLGARATGGWIRLYGDSDELPYYRRYFLGGETQIRGVDARSVGPFDKNDQAIGGDKFVVFNFELAFDVAAPARVLLFHDAGQAFTASQPLTLRALRTSSGIELRVMMPIINAPIRLIYSHNIFRDSFQPARGFRFAIGTTF